MKSSAVKQRKRKSNDDPRPMKYRMMSGKRDRIYGLMVNYTSTYHHDINLRYMFPRADLQIATLDHDYLSVPFTHLWVLNSIQVLYNT